MTRAAKVAVVTGAEKGIGLGVAERLLRDGWQVVAAGIDSEAGEQFEREHDKAVFLTCDVSSEASVAGAMNEVLERFGRIDGLVLNAGIASPRRTPVASLSLEDWNQVLGVNLTGSFLCVKHAHEALRESEGSIVAIASTRAFMSEPDTFAYSASKGGLVALTHSLAISLGPQIRANSISPGWIHTGQSSELSERDHSQHPVGRVGQPADIAGLVAYLLGPDSRFVTGQDFVVDGGMTKKMIYV